MLVIGITNYNKKLYTKELLDSLFSQINDNVKIVFVDDHSTDNSVEIVKTHPIYQLDNFELIELPINKWVSHCRNIAIEKATKEDWITFIDGDDFVADNYIETLEKYIKDNEYDVYMFDYNIVPVVDTDKNDIEKAMNVMCWSRLYRAKVLLDNNIRFEDKHKYLGYGEDISFNEIVKTKTDKITETTDVIYNYHWWVKDSLSNTHKNID